MLERKMHGGFSIPKKPKYQISFIFYFHSIEKLKEKFLELRQEWSIKHANILDVVTDNANN